MPPAWGDMAVVGRVARTHGLRGDVLVDAETDFPDERFAPGRVVFAERGRDVVPLRVARMRWHVGRPRVGFDGVDSVAAAAALAGCELRVPASELTPLPAGVHYRHDLVGCAVVTVDDRAVGRVVRVEGAAGASRLVVQGDAGREVLIPLVAELCVVVDPGAGRIVVAPPEGLLELNG